jgi:anti-sigma factor RsiW
MTCSPDVIEAYFDEELDANERAAAERHLNVCAECAAAYARLREQKAAIHASAPYYTAPAGLGAAVRDQLRRAAAKEVEVRRPSAWRWIAIAAGLLLAASLSWNVVEFSSRAPSSDLEGTLLASHIRSLIGEHLVDVISSDQHTVKPWFNGKLDFAPQVRNLEGDGFPLVGGRVDYIAGQRVAALVYRRRQHVINVFIWPAGAGARREDRLSRDGYALLHWNAGGMNYWAVSDVSAAELDRLRKLLGG